MNITFHDLIIRSPLASLDKYFEKPDSDLTTDQQLNQAVYFASRNFHRLLQKSIDDRARRVLLRYYLRSIFRSTPFGLFAGCGTVSWGNVTSILIDGAKRKTDLDYQVLSEIYYLLLTEKWFYTKLKFFKNNTIYSVHKNQYRYVEYQISDSKKYKICGIQRTNILTEIIDLTKNGKQYNEIFKVLRRKGYQYQKSHDYLLELISSKVLLSDLEPNVMHKDYLKTIIDFLDTKCNGARRDLVLFTLLEIKKILTLSDNRKIKISSYEKVYKLLEKIGTNYPDNQVLQSDVFIRTQNATLDQAIQPKLRIALAFLLNWDRQYLYQELNYFKDRFLELYGNRELPLSLLMDPEAGLGYPANEETDVSSLIDGLKLKSKGGRAVGGSEKQIKWLLRGLENAENTKSHLDLSEYNDTSAQAIVNLPPTFSIIFKVVDFKNGFVLFQDAGGSSAANLLARFAHLDPSFEKHFKYIVEQEKVLNPEVVFAEINYFPQGKLGNILKRPLLRDKEIPILSVSENQNDSLPIEDLMVSIADDQIRVRSKALNKYIIPSLSSAHNYHNSEVATYKFLCDLQHQSIRSSLGFRWPSTFDERRHLPRVTLGKTVILFPAVWRLSNKDLQKYFGKNYGTIHRTTIEEFTKYFKLPRFIVIPTYDQELVVDFTRLDTIFSLVDSIKKFGNIEVHEFLFDANTPIVDKSRNRFNHQFIATVINNTTSYSATVPEVAKKKRETYNPGSSWFYIKIYCSRSISNLIIAQNLVKITKRYQKRNDLEQWFFVRYTDPDYHIRIRIKLSKNTLFGSLLEDINRSLQPMINSHLIQKISLDTYHPELDRYGPNTMPIVEEIFFHDSQLIAAILKLSEHNNYDPNLIALKIVDSYLTAFQFSTQGKMKFCEELKTAFYQEFNIEKSEKLSIDKKYRNFSYKIHSILQTTDQQFIHPKITKLLTKFAFDIQAQAIKLKKLDGSSSLHIQTILISIIHMSINRAFPYDPRANEMVIYDFLLRYYRSSIAKSAKMDVNNLPKNV